MEAKTRVMPKIELVRVTDERMTMSGVRVRMGGEAGGA